MSHLWNLHANGDCWPDSCRACQYEDERRADWPICDEHEQPVDPEDTAPSCGAHTLCVPCFDTSNFHCPECHRIWKELDA